MTKKPIFELKNVSKIYNAGSVKTTALDKVSLEIKPGEYASLFGPSGSGKSTLMHIMGCLDTPTKGKVYIDGEEVSELDSDELAQIRREKIGFVFQAYNLIPSLTAVENVALPMRFKGVTKEKSEKEAEKLLKKVGLGERLTNKGNELSGGEQQRVSIARALINDPDAILADEPTGNLDTKTGDTIIDELERLNKKMKKTIVVVTHDPHISKKTKRQILIKDGRLQKGKEKHVKKYANA